MTLALIIGCLGCNGRPQQGDEHSCTKDEDCPREKICGPDNNCHLCLSDIHCPGELVCGQDKHCHEQSGKMPANTIRRVIINTNKAPAAIGPYNQAVMVNQTVYLSGQIGFEPTTMEIVKGGVKAEARQALMNMGEVLK